MSDLPRGLRTRSARYRRAHRGGRPPLHEWKRLGFSGTPRRCLTCHECNNRAVFESRHDDYVRAGSWQGIAHRAGEEAASMSPKRASQHARSALAGSRQGFEDQRRTELKSAYVIAFATLGWDYILDPILQPIRDLISPRSTTPLPANTCFPAAIPFERQHVVAIETPFRFLLVTHPSLHQDETAEPGDIHCIALPRPGGLWPDELYPAIAALGERQERRRYEWLRNERLPWSPNGWPRFHWDASSSILSPRTERRNSGLSILRMSRCEESA